MASMITVKCPHCDLLVSIMPSEINCGIFRHGVYIVNHQQMDPHAAEKICTRLAKDGLIYGCGKPFRLIDNKAVKCGYV